MEKMCPDRTKPYSLLGMYDMYYQILVIIIAGPVSCAVAPAFMGAPLSQEDLPNPFVSREVPGLHSGTPEGLSAVFIWFTLPPFFHRKREKHLF